MSAIPGLDEAQAAVEALMVTSLRVISPPARALDVLDEETGILTPPEPEEVWAGKGMVVDVDDPTPDRTHRIVLPLAADAVRIGHVVIGPYGRYRLHEEPQRGTFSVCWNLTATKEPTSP